MATNPKRIREAERKRRALELRKAGLTYEQIAAEIGSRRGAAPTTP
jgi:hypothetical protein